MSTTLKRALTISLLIIYGISPASASAFGTRETKAVGPKHLTPATIYRISTVRPSTDTYAATDDIRVNIFTSKGGGGLENDISASSTTIPAGDSLNFNLGRVPAPGGVPTPGLYFTRYKVDWETFINGFLVLPVAGNRFTVEIIAEPSCTATVTPAQVLPVEKFFRNLTAARLQTAAGTIAPQWFAVNGQNFVVLTAKGIVLAYSGMGFIAIVAPNGIGRDLAALTVDFIATVLARAADDMTPAVLNASERSQVKLALGGLNNTIQALLAETSFQKIITLGNAVSDLALGSDSDGAILGKIVGDSAKKFEVLIKLRRP